MRDRTVFEVEIVAAEVAFEVRVNDLPVLRAPLSRVQTRFDINPYVESGKNSLSLTVRPRTRGRDFSEHAACTVTLFQKPNPESEDATSIGTLHFSGYGHDAVTGFGQSVRPTGGDPIEVERFGAKATLTCDLETSFPPWSWSEAEKLTPTEALRAEILAEYHHVHALLAAKDLTGLSARCALQERDYQYAYYLNSAAEARKMLGIEQLVADQTIEAEPFPNTVLTLELLGNGRLVQLVEPDGKSPLRLRATDSPKMVGRFNCVFCKVGGGWQIVR
ncbi:MAG: hypothetical protein IPK82_40080 [Polyangiaceae bacterium]|nr:hypothetical protein [Polyangiaceae bacterium]